MSETSPILVWFRRDLRLSDHPALTAAVQSGRPVVPVFIRDASVDDLGAAPKYRLGLAVEGFAKSLQQHGSRLILRSGEPGAVLEGLIAETGAGAVYWSRLYDGPARERDGTLKSSLKERGIEARSFPGHVMFEPWTVETKTGGYYRVFTPMWKEVSLRDVPEPLPTAAPASVPDWPASEEVSAWTLGAEMNRGAGVLAAHVCVGEAAAQSRLEAFVEGKIADYKNQRDFPAAEATSRLSENLTYGEISPAQCWHAALRVPGRGAEHFRKEVVWREFAYHLIYHTPHITTGNWREGWDAFPWDEDEASAAFTAWKTGRTGIPFVDAAMREMYVSGTMHNRARMIVASYLTKHLMTHWKLGLKWFEDCLIDWDPASNAMGWQWTAGSGPDAAPYFRVFNPETQLEKFDPDQAYQRAWLAEPFGIKSDTALSYFEAIPRSWGLSPDDPYPEPIVTAADGRARALAAYEAREF